MRADDERELLSAFGAMDETGRRTLLEFARFLRPRHGKAVAAVEPADIPRPATESVVAAIRRLSGTYPMLEADELLHGAADLMAEHVTGGRAASAVIDDLEAMFARRYAAWRDANAGESG